MLVGYARVSTIEQTLDLQQDALRQAGCEQVFTDHISGAKSEWPGLTQALEFGRSGDILVVWKLDRLGRSLHHLIEMVSELQKRNVGFRSLTENIDTTSPGGKLIFHIFGSRAEFERHHALRHCAIPPSARVMRCMPEISRHSVGQWPTTRLPKPISTRRL